MSLQGIIVPGRLRSELCPWGVKNSFSIIVDIHFMKKATRLLVHFPINIVQERVGQWHIYYSYIIISPKCSLTKIMFHILPRQKPKYLSDLDVIMSFVKIQPKPATLSLYRMLSGLNRKEETEYQDFFQEFIHWLDSDEEITEILTKAGYDQLKK